MKCAVVTERELAKMQSLRNRLDQKCRELVADIDRQFMLKKVDLKSKIEMETEKSKKIEFLLNTNREEDIFQMWQDIEKAEMQHVRGLLF